jgi:hypothetical protein
MARCNGLLGGARAIPCASVYAGRQGPVRRSDVDDLVFEAVVECQNLRLL